MNWKWPIIYVLTLIIHVYTLTATSLNMAIYYIVIVQSEILKNTQWDIFHIFTRKISITWQFAFEREISQLFAVFTIQCCFRYIFRISEMKGPEISKGKGIKLKCTGAVQSQDHACIASSGIHWRERRCLTIVNTTILTQLTTKIVQCVSIRHTACNFSWDAIYKSVKKIRFCFY
jgi:hypothetical protein